MTRIDATLDNNCIVWLFGQYLGTWDQKEDIQKKMTKQLVHAQAER